MSSYFKIADSTSLTISDVYKITQNNILPEQVQKYSYIDTVINSTFQFRDIIFLKSSDFANGTYRIRSPGIYRLTENISFNPNPSTWNGSSLIGNDWFPTNAQTAGGLYAEYPIIPYGPYHLGFFTAISVESDNVMIDLNGYTLSQSIEHYIQQRFFSLIELASSPFLPGQGPSNFGPIISPQYVCIKNGKLGLSSHQAIHGNGMKYVIIENLTLFDNEQAGIALNGGEDIIIRNINMTKTSHNVFVNATYSQSRFIKSFVQNIINTGNPSITIRGINKSGTDILNELIAEMDTVYRDIIINKTTVTSTLYKNTKQIVDGSIYGIVLNVLGVAINDFLTSLNGKKGNKRILLQNINISHLDSSPNEIVGLSIDGKGTYGTPSQKGPVGDVFQVLNNMDTNEYYVPNVLANAQCYVSKYATTPGTANIEPYIHSDWIASGPGKALTSLLPVGTYYITNSDSMAHFMKGVIGLFLQGLQDSCIFNVTLDGLSNQGNLGEINRASPYAVPYQGNLIRGIAMIVNEDVLIKKLNIMNISSKTSRAIGIDFINNSQRITLEDYSIRGLDQGNYLDGGSSPNQPCSAIELNNVQNVSDLILKQNGILVPY